MTFDEPEVTETALAAAFRAAGHDPAIGRLAAIIKATQNQPMAKQKKFLADRAAWTLASKLLDTLARVAVPVPKQPSRAVARRNLTAELTPLAVERAARNIQKIGSRALQRFLLDCGDIYFREINAHLRDGYVLRRLAEMYPNAPDDMRVRDVRADVLERLLGEASNAVAA
jgi:hypothetical protein